MLSSLIPAITASSIPTNTPPKDLTDALSRVQDPRDRRGVRYTMAEILAILVCAVVAGARTLTMIAEWATDANRSRPVAAFGTVPTLSSIHRIAALVDPVILEAALHEWVRSQVADEPIAIDGKEVRGAKNADGTRVFLMAALTHHTGCAIG